MIGGLGLKPSAKAVVLLGPLNLRALGTGLKRKIGWPKEDRHQALPREEGGKVTVL